MINVEVIHLVPTTTCRLLLPNTYTYYYCYCCYYYYYYYYHYYYYLQYQFWSTSSTRVWLE